MTPFRWAPQEPTKVATISQFAAPKDGEASFAVRGPQGRRGLILICVWQHSAGLPRSHRNQRQFRSSQPPGTGKFLLGLHMTPTRWTCQEPTNVAAVSQFAAPRDGEASFWFAYDTIPLGPPEAHESGDAFAFRSPPGLVRPDSGLRVPPLLPGVPESGVCFAVRSPQGRRSLILVCV